MGCKVCLILVPGETFFFDSRFGNFSPISLTLGVLQGHLRRQGYAVMSTDLNIHMGKFADASFWETWARLYDKQYILERIDAKDSYCEMDKLLDRMLSHTSVSESDVVGISTGANMSFFEIHLAFLLGSRIKEITGKPVIFGGANLDYLWQFRDSFKDLWNVIIKNFRYLLLGPGEYSLQGLIHAIEHGNGEAVYKTLAGAVYRDNDVIVCNPYDKAASGCPDFEGLSLSSHSLCLDISSSLQESEQLNLYNFYKLPLTSGLTASSSNARLSEACRKETLFIPYIFNHYCPYNCAYCVQSRKDKPEAPYIDAKEVVDNLEKLMRSYDTCYFHFYNNAFNFSMAFVSEFCREIQRRKIKLFWSDCARFSNMDEKVINEMYKAGCRKLVFGLDSASEKILRLIHKGIDIEQARKVLHWCKKAGIWVELEIIVGLPWETEQEFLETYKFVEEQMEEGNISGFHVNRYFIIPDSLLGRSPEKYGIQIECLDDGYDRVLKRDLELLSSVTDPFFSFKNFSALSSRHKTLWRYYETGGRSADQIEDETDEKFIRIMELKKKYK